ncbi:FecR family protein [Bacteroides sp.]
MKKQQQEFDELMTDFLSGSLSEEDTRNFYALLKSDMRYRQRYEEMTKVHAKSFVPYFEKQKSANYEHLAHRLGMGQAKRSLFLPWQKMRRVAAVALLLLTTSVASYYVYKDLSTSATTALCRMEVPQGSQSKIVLPDGSEVCLNSGSILEYEPDFGRSRTREVRLVGEGYFQVSKDPAKPFIVHTNDIHVKVLGTVFNMRAYSNDHVIEVSLIEGKVNVFSKSETSGNVILRPNERLTYDKDSKKMWTDNVDAKRFAQWTTGRLNFVNASLVDIMKDIERKYNIRIVVNSKHMEGEIFSGSISPKLTIDEILDYIDVDNKFRWERSGSVVTISDK